MHVPTGPHAQQLVMSPSMSGDMLPLNSFSTAIPSSTRKPISFVSLQSLAYTFIQSETPLQHLYPFQRTTETFITI